MVGMAGPGQKHIEEVPISKTPLKAEPVSGHFLFYPFNACVNSGKKFGGYLKSWTSIYHLIQQYHSWGYTQKTVTPEAPAHPCLLQHYSQ
jgi:hypothetical protein